VAQLRPHTTRIESAGARILAIGNGGPHFVAGFRETTGFTGPVLVDPSLAAYEAAGLRRSAVRLLDPRGVVDLARALRGGFRQSRTQGDATQLGGVLVVRPPGEIVYRHAAGRPGDLAPPEAIVSAVESVGRAS
jgi:hypothetical protein